ncbi:MAG: hypothetical protein WCK70_04275 [Chloroflexales bacterium]|jgi:uncharacterized cupredoxin-like copper-binding protein
MKRVLRAAVLVSLLSLSVVAVTGCGTARVSASSLKPLRQETVDGASQVNVTIKSYSVTPDTLSIPAGKVSFHVNNADPSITHEMLVIHAQGDSFGLPYDFAISRVIEDQVDKPGEVPDIQAGTSGDVTLNLTPGRYVLICNLVAHYQAGMHTLIDVVPSAK